MNFNEPTLLRFDIGSTYVTLSSIHMDQEPLLVTLFFTFMIGAGFGFYLARFFF